MHNNKHTPFFARPTPIAVAVALSLAAGAAQGADAPPVIPEVQVVGALDAGYAAKGPLNVLKSDTPLRDTPQAVTVITRKLIEDQGMQSMADAIRYVPGIVTAQGEGNRDAAVFRGNASTSDFFIDGIRDDVQYYRDFYNIERIEAIKGANAMIFGRGGAGGAINRVSKQAGWNRVRDVALSVGSYDHKRVAVDVGDAVNANVALRLNAMAESSESYRDGVEFERKGINPTMTLRTGPATSISLGYEHFQDERVADRGFPSFQGRPFDAEVSTFFGSVAQSPTAVRVNAFNAYLVHGFGNGLVLRNRTRIADYDKYYQNVYANSAVSPTTGQLALGAYRDSTERSNRFNQTDLSYVLRAGGVKHTLTAGLEIGRQETDNARRAGVFPGSTMVPASNPTYAGIVGFPKEITNNHSVVNVASVYAQDQIELSPQWQLLAGLRYDRIAIDFRNRLASSNGAFEVKDSPVSPRVGLIYKPVEAMSLYASYSRAYVPRAGDQLTSLNVSNRALDPERFDNMELGVKWDIHRALSASAAIYRLDTSNVVVPGPVAGTSMLVDGQTTEGVELELTGQLTRAWSVMGGYAYQNAELTADQSASIRAGAKLAMVPEHTFSMWNRYDFSPQLGAALGLVYRDSLYTSTSNKVMLPSFTRVDGAVFYRVNPQLRLQLNVENLFDRKYYASAHNDNNITPGAPRSLKLSLHAGF